MVSRRDDPGSSTSFINLQIYHSRYVASYTRHSWSIILANAPNEAPNGNLDIFKKLYIVLKLQIIPRHHNCGHSSCPIDDDCSTALRMPMFGLPNHKTLSLGAERTILPILARSSKSLLSAGKAALDSTEAIVVVGWAVPKTQQRQTCKSSSVGSRAPINLTKRHKSAHLPLIRGHRACSTAAAACPK